MKKILHIIASPKGSDSNTLTVSKKFIEAFLTTHDGWVIEELHVYQEKMPNLCEISDSGKATFAGEKNASKSLQDSWKLILSYIDQFKSADMYLISTPMWNFSVPYHLKHYIDLIVQSKHLFRYTKEGIVEGLVCGKKMVIITSRGSDYTSNLKSLDFLDNYLKTIFAFVGFEDFFFIDAQGMDMGSERRLQGLALAKNLAQKLAKEINL